MGRPPVYGGTTVNIQTIVYGQSIEKIKQERRKQLKDKWAVRVE